MRNIILRKDSHGLVLFIFFSALLYIIPSCGGGGGGGPSTATPPFIYAELFSQPTGTSLPGYESAFVAVLDDNTGDPISTAIVAINGVTLSYNSSYGDYEGDVAVAPGESVLLNITVGGRTYIASGTQFSSYPTIIQPATGTIWDPSLPHAVEWTGNYPTTNTSLGLGILDGTDPNGQLLWPSDGYLQAVPSYQTAYTIPENSLTLGNRDAIVCIWKDVSITGAAMGSVLSIGGFNYAPFTVANVSLVSIDVGPTNPSIANGTSQQFIAIGTYSDFSTKDITGQVTWSSSDTTTVVMENYAPKGMAYSLKIGSATITATMDGVSNSTQLTITPAVLASITVSPSGTTVPIGSEQQFKASGLFTDHTEQDITSSVTWTSSSTLVVVISNDAGSAGKATAKASGETTITASAGGISGSATVTVTTWTLRDSGTTAELRAVCSSGAQLVVVGMDGTIVSSPDAVTWTIQQSGTTNDLYGIARSNTLYVAVGMNGTVLTSPDGKSWSSQSSGTAKDLYGIAWSGTLYIAVGLNGTIVTSQDGAAWEPQQSGTTNDLYAVLWSDSKFIAVGGSNQTILTSSDGTTWQQQTSPVTLGILRGVAWSGTQYVAAGEWGAPVLITSPDAVAWTSRYVGPGLLKAVAWTGSQFVTVGSYGRAYASVDGITWNQVQLGTYNFLYGVSQLETKVVIVGEYGLILTSP